MCRRLAALALAAALCCHAQPTNIAELHQRSVHAYQAKDYATFLAIQKQILAFSPGDTSAMYNAACGEALLGHAPESVRLLDRLLALQLDMRADTDKDLDGIHSSPEWKHFQQNLATLRTPLVQSSTAFVLPEKGLVATSLAVDETTGITFIGSARQRKIIKRTADGALSDFATAAKDGLLAVRALLLDPLRKQLIASVAAVPFMQDFQKADAGKSGLCIFDLVTGKLVRQVFLPIGEHLLASAAVDKAGNIYVVDAASSEIYRLRRSSSELELFVSSVVFRAPRGLTLSPDETTLYVSDYASGLWALEVLSNDRRLLAMPANVWLAGLDGLTPVPGGFLAVETGVLPNRVLRIQIDAKAYAVMSVATLESNHPAYRGPVQGTISGADFLYIADSRSAASAQEEALLTTVLRLPLTASHPSQ